jgi:SWIM/SEC-C metal-binding protein
MSDKFFFKGRQESRQHHTQLGFQTNPSQKIGSKKYPLNLVVTSEERQHELAHIVTEAGLFAQITLDRNEGAVESITELTTALNKVETVVLDKVPERNEPCLCGSGKKYKKCCG